MIEFRSNLITSKVSKNTCKDDQKVTLATYRATPYMERGRAWGLGAEER